MKRTIIASLAALAACSFGLASPALANASTVRPAKHQIGPVLDACSDPANLCIRHGSLPSVGLLPIGRRFSAPDHKANLVFQSDGDLVVYDENNGAPWGSNTFAPGSVGIFQADGNLVVDSQAGSLLWATGTNSHPDDVLVVQGDGNVAIYDPGNVQLWATHTNH